MARLKSSPGSKTGRAKKNVEQTGDGVAANVPVKEVVAADVKEVMDVKEAAQATLPAATAAKVTPEVKPVHEGRTATEAKAAAESKAAEMKTPSDGRRFEVVRTESRKNLVPINLEDEIRRRAYELYQQRGSGFGSEADDWLTAEREIRQRYHQHSA
jgi:hypothetical protein